MITICITGGSGFIGTNVMEYYLAQPGVRVYNLDWVAPKNPAHANYWHKVDILDTLVLDEAIKELKPDYIIHLAARTDLLEAKDINNYRVNFEGTQNLIRSISAVSTVKRVIFASSMLVCSLGYVPENDEDFCPTTLYGKSKMMMEEMLRTTPMNFEWCIVRPTSIWGPWFGEPYKAFFDMILAKKYFHIGGAETIKTYGYIGNAVAQINQLLITDKKIQGEVFYLGDYEYYNVHVWANEIAGELGIRIPTLPFWIFKGAGWVGDMLKRMGKSFPMTSFRLKNMTVNNCMDTQRIRYILPVAPYTRQQGNKATLDWILKQNH